MPIEQRAAFSGDDLELTLWSDDTCHVRIGQLAADFPLFELRLLVNAIGDQPIHVADTLIYIVSRWNNLRQRREWMLSRFDQAGSSVSARGWWDNETHEAIKATANATQRRA